MVPTVSTKPKSGTMPSDKLPKDVELGWGYHMPLTPPSSPVLYTTTHGDDEFDSCFRIQPVCGFYDEISVEHAYALAHTLEMPMYTRPGKSVVIKDCMWGHWSTTDGLLRCQENEHKVSIIDRTVEMPSVDDTLDTSSSKYIGVDPSEVFPHHDEAIRMQSDSSDSDEESDVDVVTVESTFQPAKAIPRIPSLLSPPKTPDMEINTNDNNALDYQSSQTQTASKLNISQSVVQSLVMLAASQASSKSPKKQGNAVGDVKYSRTSHNVLERKRRNELKMRFYNLRDAIPELSENDKVPKVTILKQAIVYIKSLKTEENVLIAEQHRQRKLNAELRRKLVTFLKRN